MCNLIIQEEIISHPITGRQEDQIRSGQVRSVLPFLSSLIDSLNQSLPGHLRSGIQKNPMLRQVRSQGQVHT